MKLYRLANRQVAPSAKAAFSGEGAKLYGARWNSKGVPVVYTATSELLAIVELLVHNVPFWLLQKHYCFYAVEIDDSLLTTAKLPADWRKHPAPSSTMRVGDDWCHSKSSLGLLVPSAVKPDAQNCLLNPLFPHYPKLVLQRVSKAYAVLPTHVTAA